MRVEKEEVANEATFYYDFQQIYKNFSKKNFHAHKVNKKGESRSSRKIALMERQPAALK